VGFRHRARIEEVRGVVELDPTDRLAALSPRRSRGGKLGRYRAARRVAPRRLPPQIAHRAPPRAFSAGQEYRADARDLTPFGELVFDSEVVKPPRIVRRPRTA